MTKERSFTFDLAQPQWVDSLIKCVQKTFPGPQGEVMAAHLGISPLDYLGFSEHVCQKAVKEQLTWVARDSSREIVGFCISEAMSTAPPYSNFSLSSKFAPLLDLLENLDNRYLIENPTPADEIFHLYMLGVTPAFTGLGLGRKLLDSSLRLAQELGFKLAIAEATGRVSQSLCSGLGFEKKVTISYEDFFFRGGTPFLGLKEPESCVLFEKKLWD